MYVQEDICSSFLHKEFLNNLPLFRSYVLEPNQVEKVYWSLRQRLILKIQSHIVRASVDGKIKLADGQEFVW